ncbi:SIMPL domain-containing protein [Limimaricola litoreus]|uniref:SIMPL domain-containing protein n=1 Tax=Limimaricola litoreus TaxID=2955316 RepID=A0A9X2FMN2_9RHOB|nr:SIMPL domain-containing protein [Limimaricola litoreus]MCP1167252.1 SIMPL domain-containing protein [Limimaricola litoreus]
MTFARLAALALVTGLAVPAMAQMVAPAMAQTGQSTLAPVRSITVAGEGHVRAAPEMARVRLGVSETAPTARAALDAMNAAMARVLDQLSAAGIAPEDVQTGQLSLDRDYARARDGQSEPEGFVASTLVELRVQEIDSLGAVLDAAVGEGANRLQGIEFMLADQAAARNEARRAAVADAQARAALYAQSAEVALGEVLSISESNISSGPQPMMGMRMAAAESVPIAQGEVEVSAGVTLVFAID